MLKLNLCMIPAAQPNFKFYRWGIAALMTPTTFFVTGDPHIHTNI